MRRPALALLLATALASACAAQEGGFRVLLQAEGPSGEEEAYAASLEAALFKVPGIAMVRVADSDIAEAGKLGYDLALLVRIEESLNGVRLSWVWTSAASGRAVGERNLEAPKPSRRELALSFWDELVASAPAALNAAGRVGSSLLTIHGRPGAEVVLSGALRLVLSPGGEALVSVKSPGTQAWKASLAGYERASGLVSAFGPEAKLDIVLRSDRVLAYELGLNKGAFPDFWASRSFFGDRLFLRAGLYQYFLGFSLASEEPGYDPPFLLCYFLLQPGLGTGWKFGSSGDESRLYLGLTASARVALLESGACYIDPIAPLCASPFVGLEWKPFSDLGFFAELGLDLYPFADAYLLKSSIGSSSQTTAQISGEDWLIQFPSLRFGSRLHL
jgi:hypothetical protein